MFTDTEINSWLDSPAGIDWLRGSSRINRGLFMTDPADEMMAHRAEVNAAEPAEPHRPAPILKYFAYDHLPSHLQVVSAGLCELARVMDRSLPAGPEKSAGLRKLLEAKDCFVRARLEAPK